MKRDLLHNLILWKDSKLRKPLILHGARQVGKSWLIKEFGAQFNSFVTINFEKEKSAALLFQGDINVNELIEKISMYTRSKIIPGETLLFLDEVQECEEALLTLRYFKEELPDLHVVAAGSLLDFTLDKISFPVGRVQFMYLYPLSFGEFLTASANEDLRNYIQTKSVDAAIHPRIMELLRVYLWLGGMPAVVDAWLKYKDLEVCQNLQAEIITSYKQDFNKYARNNAIDYVEKVFLSIPANLGRKFKFSNVDRDVQAVHLKKALLLLEKAGLAHIVYHSAAHEQPLGASKNESRFKVFFPDISFAQHILGLNLKNWVLQEMSLKTLGSIAEQFVAQEIIAYSSINEAAKLFYWHREAKSSNAEIDFLLIKKGQIIPVEVKAGSKGTLRSLHQFLLEHNKSPYGLKVADGLFEKNDTLEQIPLYGIEAWLKE